MKSGIRVVSLLVLLMLPACPAGSDAVVIAVVAPSGSFEHVRGQVQNGARLAADELNRRGGIDGRELRIAIVHGADPSTERSRLGSIVRTQKPIAVITYENLLEVNASHPARQARVPVVSLGGSSPNAGGDFAMGFGAADEAKALADWLVGERGLTKVAIARGSSDRWERQGARALRSALEEAGAVVTGESELADGIDALQQAQALRSAGSDAVAIWASPAHAARLTLAIRSIGWDVQLAGPSSFLDPSFRSLAGPSTDGFAVASPAISEEAWLSPRLTDWFLDYHERFTILPIADQRTLVAGLPYAAVQAYDAVQILASSVAEADSAGREAIRAVIRNRSGHEGVLTTYGSKAGLRLGRFYNLALIYDVGAESDPARSSAFYKAQVSGFYVPERYLDTEEGQKLVERILEQVLSDPEGVEFFRQYSPPRPAPGPV